MGKKLTSIYLDDELKSRVQVAAKQDERPVSQWIVKVIKEYLKEEV